MNRKIASGWVYRKSYRDRATGQKRYVANWTIAYYDRGQRITESAGTKDQDEAERILRQKMDSLANHESSPRKVLVSQLLDLVISDMKRKRRRSVYDVQTRIEAHLRPAFGNLQAAKVTTRMIRDYADRRIAEKKTKAKTYAEATVNKELAYLRRAFRLGQRETPPLVLTVPYFEMFTLDNAREGIVEHPAYQAIRDRLPQYARTALVIGYHTGARKGEITSIVHSSIDLANLRIRREGRHTKNGTPRYLPIYGDMKAEIEKSLAEAAPDCPYLIQDAGQRVYDFEKAWKAACKGAGIPGTLFHDLRRTAATNLIEAGWSEKEAMEVTGHKTRYIFDRYHIVKSERLAELAKKAEAHLKSKEGSNGASNAASLKKEDLEVAVG